MTHPIQPTRGDAQMYISADAGVTWIPWDGVVTATVSGADGAVLDGANPAIKGTVLDYPNSNPQAVALVDTNGDTYVASGAPASSTSVLANVAESLVNVTLLAANASRLGFVITNDSDGILLVKFGTTASATSFTVALLPRQTFTTNDAGVNYKGRIDGIWLTTPGTAGHATARVTELT